MDRDKRIRHKLSECRDFPKDEKAKLYEQLRKSRNKKKQNQTYERYHQILQVSSSVQPSAET